MFKDWVGFLSDFVSLDVTYQLACKLNRVALELTLAKIDYLFYLPSFGFDVIFKSSESHHFFVVVW